MIRSGPKLVLDRPTGTDLRQSVIIWRSVAWITHRIAIEQ